MSQAPPKLNAPPQPVTGTTEYDKASAAMIAAVAGLLALTGLLAAIWLTNRSPASQESVSIEVIAMSGGFEDGNPDDSPELEFPRGEISDPAIAETTDDQSQIEEMLEILIELSDSTSQRVDRAIQSEASGKSGKVGTTSGIDTGPRTGSYHGTETVGREQRWMIKFDEGDLVTYAKQLDFFKIELGALFKDGRLVFIKDMSRATPTKRQVQTGKGEYRLFMTWKVGSRKQADAALFKKAGVPNAEIARLMHFYPPETEQLLARTECGYRKRKTSEIRSTYFTMRKDGPGFKFVVISQSYLR